MWRESSVLKGTPRLGSSVAVRLSSSPLLLVLLLRTARVAHVAPGRRRRDRQRVPSPGARVFFSRRFVSCLVRLP